MQKQASSFTQQIHKQIELLRKNYDFAKNAMSSGFALFGAGQFGQAALRYFQKKGFSPQCFIDNSLQKQGQMLGGVPIVADNHPLATSSSITFITARHVVPQIAAQLNNSKIRNISFDSYFVIDNLLQYDRVKKTLFSDQRSVRCLEGIILAMLSGKEMYCADIMEPNQYFCLPRFVNNGDEYFVDAGAYVGDTLERFIWANNGRFKHIYAFEPSDKQLVALRKRVERLIGEWALNKTSISIINAGLSDMNSKAVLDITPGALQCTKTIVYGSGNLNDTVQLYSLDEYLDQLPVTFIKADIEGMEVPMLKGAVETIKRNKPKMALSTYHEPTDLFDIVDFVSNLVPEYKFALRHHSPLLMESTLYCWID